MEHFDKPSHENEMKDLREGIKRRYNYYHLLDRDRFPELEYNTNRANYEHLRESFEEEFYVVRGIDRTKGSIHIPSTNTLALIFSDDKYIPGRKILNTCRSYAEGKTKANTATDIHANKPFEKSTSKKNGRVVVLLGLGLLGAGFAIHAALTQLNPEPPASGLTIYHPYHGQFIPRLSFAEGRVSNADTVWIVIRPVEGSNYWVQPPIKVENDKWKGLIYIGSVDKGDIGVRSQVRAFVNPTHVVKEGDVLTTWPEAELSSEAIVVVRKGND